MAAGLAFVAGGYALMMLGRQAGRCFRLKRVISPTWGKLPEWWGSLPGTVTRDKGAYRGFFCGKGEEECQKHLGEAPRVKNALNSIRLGRRLSKVAV